MFFMSAIIGIASILTTCGLALLQKIVKTASQKVAVKREIGLSSLIGMSNSYGKLARRKLIHSMSLPPDSIFTLALS